MGFNNLAFVNANKCTRINGLNHITELLCMQVQ